MYTTHGHHIPGTTETDTNPNTITRCGGVRLCRACTNEAVDIYLEMLSDAAEADTSSSLMPYEVVYRPTGRPEKPDDLWLGAHVVGTTIRMPDGHCWTIRVASPDGRYWAMLTHEETLSIMMRKASFAFKENR